VSARPEPMRPCPAPSVAAARHMRCRALAPPLRRLMWLAPPRGTLTDVHLVRAPTRRPARHRRPQPHEHRARTRSSAWSDGSPWNLTAASPDERDELARWITVHKELRPLRHRGAVLNGDRPDPHMQVHGSRGARSPGRRLRAGRRRPLGHLAAGAGPPAGPRPERPLPRPPAAAGLRHRRWLARSAALVEPESTGLVRPGVAVGGAQGSRSTLMARRSSMAR
jgi:hypothetical protein